MADETCNCCGKPIDKVECQLARSGRIPRPCRTMRNAFVLNVNQRGKPIDWAEWTPDDYRAALAAASNAA